MALFEGNLFSINESYPQIAAFDKLLIHVIFCNMLVLDLMIN